MQTFQYELILGAKPAQNYNNAGVKYTEYTRKFARLYLSRLWTDLDETKTEFSWKCGE